VCADVHAPEGVAFHVEDRAQIAFDADGVNGDTELSGESVDFVWTQARVEGILLKDFPSAPSSLFLMRGQPIK
jgi:hypothetical protein